jgi:hypothetical protein
MGKVVPFARKTSCGKNEVLVEEAGSAGLKRLVSVPACEERAEQLIGEAAKLLAEAGHGDGAVPWILEDCIELLRSKGIETSAPIAASESLVVPPSGTAQPDPRLKLNANPEVSTFIRK